jgi:phosphoribosylamine--glycine ligase
MRIAVIGSGARENALSWALAKNIKDVVWTLPGNGGSTYQSALAVDDFVGIENFCREKEIDLIVVGQEQPLALGIQNNLSQKGFCIFGPSREAARLESSKIWSKQFMERNSIQTSPFVCIASMQDAEKTIEAWDGDCVIKWDGLAAGKGVAVCHDKEQAYGSFHGFLSKFSSTEFVIEKRLEGRELSVFIVTNGDQYLVLPPAKDYKRAYDHDEGPNTGGMGAVSCDSLMDEKLKKSIEEKIIKPTLLGLKKENIPYVGFLYFGLMISDGEPFLLEYNVRLGDPETSAVLPRLETPLLNIVTACLEGALDTVEMEVKKDPCVNVVIASKGYPDSFETGYKVTGLESVCDDAYIFHAGTRKDERDGVITSGGRILNCVGCGNDIHEARSKAYALVQSIEIPSSYYRQDIGEDCFEEERRHLNLRNR